MTDAVFTLEVLNAFHGDCLILHYGTHDEPRLMLIDGGPNGTFDTVLRPRLLALAAHRGKSFRLDHIMISHLDDDHIAGILQLVDEIESGDAPWQAPSFWFNSFDDGLRQAPPALAVACAALGRGPGTAGSGAVRQASIRQGRRLRDAVTRLQATQNGGARHALQANGAAPALPIPGLALTLVCPDRRHLDDLAARWMRSPGKAAQTAAYVDQSVLNLSSLVVVVQPQGAAPGPRMLLTGDARGDHILAGLEGAGLLAGRPTHFELLKVPHHGSDRNLSLDFFQAITADYYVISGDGRHGNPSEQVLDWIARTASPHARVCLTYDHNVRYPDYGRSVANVLARHPALARQLMVRQPGELLMRIDLLAPLRR
ncbi:MBL fold metallo-hydrolase [Herbaspirillum sp. YR522]|uniref:MBL fold metallo-hydrolase n=1 Tax=Herbaspirillum sp. YR522 TaxID=1144342 RepID=UPI00026F7F9C|nr:MBL fold metallo-hydrolase [Herbaspirillum sp. YR522]EJN03254.1 hypothetical protein PMI40_02803 [Herbaspirillum sp. YR522]